MMDSDMNIYFNLTDAKRVTRSLTLTLYVPPRAEVQEAIEQDESVHHKTKFSSEFMAQIPHDVITTIRYYEPTHLSLGLFIKITSGSQNRRAGIIDGDRASLQILNDSNELIEGCEVHLMRESWDTYRLPAYHGYQFLVVPWPEQALKAKFTIPVYVQKRLQLIEERPFQLNLDSSTGKLDTKAFFMSDSFSDVKVKCKGQEFPAHRLVLAGKSPVFEAMVSHPMKEGQSGIIELNDDDPDVLTELFRFMYTGKVADGLLEDEEKIKDLYVLADKYNVEDLALLCEFKLVKNLKPENALVLYDLAQRRPESLLAKRALQIISTNRAQIAEDVESFRNFTINHPDLIFEIFRR